MEQLKQVRFGPSADPFSSIHIFITGTSIYCNLLTTGCHFLGHVTRHPLNYKHPKIICAFIAFLKITQQTYLKHVHYNLQMLRKYLILV
jgi:hypothetical protein